MASRETTELFDLAAARSSEIRAASLCAAAHRLDASAFLDRGVGMCVLSTSPCGQTLSEIADVFTVYIQTPLLCYVEPFRDSRPYLTTSELGEYQRGCPSHVSLLADPRLIGWEIKRNTVVLSRSGRVGEAYWVDKKLSGSLVGDSFRVVPRDSDDAFFIYALLASPYARDYVSGVAYGSVVSHASVEQVRALAIPELAAPLRSRISDLTKQAVLARDSAYDLLDSAEESLLACNGIAELGANGPKTFDPMGQPTCFTVGSKAVDTQNGDGSEHRLDAHYYNPTARQAVANIREGGSPVKTVGEVTERVMMGPRFKRNYVDSDHGVPFLSGKNIVQIRPTDLKYLSNLQMADMQELLVKQGWTLVTCSGTIGRTCFVWDNYEDYAASQHILRVIPDEKEIDPGYLYAFLSSRYGYEQILRCRHGSVIDEITDRQIKQVLVPCPSRKDQEAIGDMVRQAYEKRGEAIRLEDEAQKVLAEALTKTSGGKGV